MSTPRPESPTHRTWVHVPRPSRVSAVDVVNDEAQGPLVVTGGIDGEITLGAGGADPTVPIEGRTGTTITVVRLVPVPDDPLVVAADEDGQLRWWHIATGRRLGERSDPYGERVITLAAAVTTRDEETAGQDGGHDPAAVGVVAGTASGLVLRLPLPLGTGPERPWPGSADPDPLVADGPVTGLAVQEDRDGLLIAAGTDTGSLHCWDGESGRRLGPPVEVGQPVTALTLARTGNGRSLVLVGCRDGSVRAWRPDGRRVGLPLREHTAAITGLAVLRYRAHPDVLLSADRSGTVCRWDLTQGDLLAQPDRDLTSLRLGTGVAAASTSGAEALVAVVGDGLLMVRRVPRWSEPAAPDALWPPPLHDKPPTQRSKGDVIAAVVSVLLPLLAVGGVVAAAVVVGRWGSSQSTPGGLAQFVLLCGVASMMTVESAKRLLPLRAAYHRTQLRRWLGRRLGPDGGARAAAQLGALLEPGPRRRRRWRRFLAGDVVSSVLNLPLEQFLAQLALAVERAFAVPEDNADLLRAFAAATTRLDRAGTSDPDDGADVQGQLAASVDQLQAWLGSRWQFHLRLTTWWLSGVIGAALVAGRNLPQAASGDYAVAALAFGGFVAWLSRDLVATLERVRR